MNLKFSFDEFMAMLADYNKAIWPLQIIVYLVTIAILVMMFIQVRHSGKILAAWLGVLWFWVGVVFNLMYFNKLTQGANVFGVMFLLQGVLFLYGGFARNDMVFRLNPGWRGLTGLVIMLYALVGYPALEYAWGRGYPEILPFGLVPCPLTVFSLGILLLSVKKIPGYLVIIPVLYSFGGIIPFSLGIEEDIGLIISGLLVLIIWLLQRRNRHSEVLVM
jgi:hypothetical protein